MIFTRLLIATTLASTCGTALADYTPDTREFPASAPLELQSQPALALDGGGAIEFWVDAGWTQSTSYHPVILSNGHHTRPNYQLSITSDRAALAVRSGNQYGLFPYDFSTGGSRHVALLAYENRLIAFINGKLIGSVAMTIRRTLPGRFTVGSAADGRAPFIGAISALRIWDVPLSPESIATYALRDVNDADAPHPNLANLLAISDFNNGTVAVVDSFVLAETELMSRDELASALGEAELRRLDRAYDTDSGETDE